MKKFEEPKFEKTEFEAVAYLCTGSNEQNNGGSHSHSHKNGHNFPNPCPPIPGKPCF